MVPVAVGWLYLLRDAGALALGPAVRGALPLQQLAGTDDQPLLRLLLVWIPAGAVGARVLARPGSTRVAGPVLRMAALTAVLLVLAGAVSDAAAISDPIPTHVAAQLWRPGNLVAVALVALGALLSRTVLRGPREVTA